MIDLTKRSELKELLDGDDIPFADIRQNMKELNIVNTILGGHAITVSGVRHFTSEYAGNKKGSQSLRSVKSVRNILTICEIGCGGGDNLAAINNWSKGNGIKVQLTGIDIKKECTDYASHQYPDLHATWITNDYAAVTFDTKPDIIFSSLFCHHFSDSALVSMLQWMQANSRLGFFINDLHRHPAAYYSIKLISRIFSRSYLLKNDAPLSVARGFKKEEWIRILEKAGIMNYSIRWKWAFRYLIVCKNE